MRGKFDPKLTPSVANSQGRNLERLVCLLELPVCLAQKGDLGESGKCMHQLRTASLTSVTLKWQFYLDFVPCCNASTNPSLP